MRWLGVAAFAIVAIGAAVRIFRLKTEATSRGLDRWAIWEIVGIVNFLAFVIIGAWLGGFALLGRRGGDEYFLRDHGFFTRVSAPVYWYSVVHMASQVITFPMFLAAAFRSAIDRDTPGTGPSIRGRGAA